MEFLELAKKRYSSRSYKAQPVEEEKIMKILEAGRIAPSAANLQPSHFVVIREKKNIEKISSAYHREWLKFAPVIIVVCGDHSVSWKRSDGKDYCDIDIAIAVDHMTLQAAELSLGTCWICNFNVAKCKEILNLPKNIEPIVLLPIAYPLDSPNLERHNNGRKKLDKIVHWEKF
jgi:nitroreductase